MNVIKKNLLFSLIVCSIHSFSMKNEIEMHKYVANLMSRMTVKEKIGQLNLTVSPEFVAGDVKNHSSSSLEMRITNGEIGGLFGFKGAARIKDLQKIAIEKSRLHIPLLFGLDVIHGYDVTFPIPLALASSWNTELIEQVARTSAIEASSDGVCWVFSPMVDISRDCRWGRFAEGAGEDPFLGGEIAKAWVKGYQTNNDLTQNNNVMACVKHYALYGAVESGRDYNTVDMSRQRMLNEYMRPYQVAAEQGAGSFMASFNEFEGLPVTANKYLLNDILRKQWGFNGLLVSDYTGIMEMVNHGIGNEQTVTELALKAGIDMDMVSEFYTTYLEKAVNERKILEKEIDNACRRVLEAKYKLGLFDNPYKYCNKEYPNEILGNQKHVIQTRKVAQESMVLLKNQNNLLPLNRNAHIALIGPLADRAYDMLGCWSGNSQKVIPVSLLEGLKNAVGTKGTIDYAEGSYLVSDKNLEQTLTGGAMGFVSSDGIKHGVHQRSLDEMIKEALELANKSDVVIAALGENANMNGEGASRSNTMIPEPQRKLLETLVQTGKPIVLVVFTGRPLILTWEDQNVSAILNAWFPGVQAGNAIADILFGDINPSGKITASFPRNVGQIPIYYNHKNTGRPQNNDTTSYVRFRSNYIDVVNAPLYPFGYGLSYSSYEYNNLKLSTNKISASEKAIATITIKNTSAKAGKETAQLYIHDMYSTSTRPVQELKGFKQIELKAGESKEVSFEINIDLLKYYNHDLRYVCEPGDFEIMIGPNSRNVEKAMLTVVE